MKRVIYTFFFLLLPIIIYPQQSDVEISKVGFYPRVIAENTVDQYARDLLMSKLNEIILQNGIGDIGNNQFVLLAKIDFIEESSVPTIPPLFKVVFDVQLIVADMLMKKKFGVYNINNCIGINRNKNRAVIRAMGRVKSSRNTVNWLKDTKDKIIDYYKNNCYNVILEANTLSEQYKYDEAIFLLSKMPKVSTQCFMMAQDVMSKIFKEKNLHDVGNEYNISKKEEVEKDSIINQQTNTLKQDTLKIKDKTTDSIYSKKTDFKETPEDYEWIIE